MDGQLHLNGECIQLINKYVEDDLVFCGVIRSKGPRSPFLEYLFKLTHSS